MGGGAPGKFPELLGGAHSFPPLLRSLTDHALWLPIARSVSSYFGYVLAQ